MFPTRLPGSVMVMTRLAVVVALLALAVGACGLAAGSPPAATPADFPGITAELATEVNRDTWRMWRARHDGVDRRRP